MNNFKKEFACVASMMAGGMMADSEGIFMLAAFLLMGIPSIYLIVKTIKKNKNESV